MIITVTHQWPYQKVFRLQKEYIPNVTSSSSSLSQISVVISATERRGRRTRRAHSQPHACTWKIGFPLIERSQRQPWIVPGMCLQGGLKRDLSTRCLSLFPHKWKNLFFYLFMYFCKQHRDKLEWLGILRDLFAPHTGESYRDRMWGWCAVWVLPFIRQI